MFFFKEDGILIYTNFFFTYYFESFHRKYCYTIMANLAGMKPPPQKKGFYKYKYCYYCYSSINMLTKSCAY